MIQLDRRQLLQRATVAPIAAMAAGCAHRSGAASASAPAPASATPAAASAATVAGDRLIATAETAASGLPARVVRGSASLAAQRNAPCSTFKIPLTLMLLEEGIVSDIDQTHAVDASTYQPESWWLPAMEKAWNKPHSLRTGYAFSAIWLYRTLAKQLGLPRMRRYVALFDYGDGDLSHGVDNFWNAGDRGLKISPLEQCRFLADLAERRFPLRASTYDRAFDVFAGKHQDSYTVFSKTGLGWHGVPGQSMAMGWMVGWVRQGESVADGQRTLPFASYADAPTLNEVISHRRGGAETAFRQRGFRL